jgi:hypothetical protein
MQYPPSGDPTYAIPSAHGDVLETPDNAPANIEFSGFLHESAALITRVLKKIAPVTTRMNLRKLRRIRNMIF